ncbi:Medium-chain acyl-CoA dehydrogenase [Nocardia seriolae]|uniref:Medium-chain acyl-CoA dehydrogenase n=1 Tax=Nocardia seriolae TaxID=37332 RepID=A0ABC8AV99_9NOCA|nr:Medium-chain acyl-CoA dehydrogenase [Nocardia seriolae]
MKRGLCTEDHERYRDTVREFLARTVVPHLQDWDDRHLVDREALRAAARTGVYALAVPEQYGGAGETDYRYRLVVKEETARVHATSFAVTLGLQDDIVLHYLLNLCTEEQKRRWLPGFATGDLLGAIAMTEPGAGSDLQGTTTAVRNGENWILNGHKTFISSGTSADIAVVAARTDAAAGKRGLSLFVVERGMAGFTSGAPLRKLGLHGQDTAELHFDDVVVPQANLLGVEGHGLFHLFDNLVPERVGVIAETAARARVIFEETLRYTKERRAFGRAIADFQHTRLELAEMATELDVAETYVDRTILAYNAGELTAVDAAKGKWYLSELQKRVVDRCLQLHGGYGLHDGVPGRARLRRHPHPHHLRGDHRDHEGDHRPRSRRLTVERWPSVKRWRGGRGASAWPPRPRRSRGTGRCGSWSARSAPPRRASRGAGSTIRLPN